MFFVYVGERLISPWLSALFCPLWSCCFFLQARSPTLFPFFTSLLSTIHDDTSFSFPSQKFLSFRKVQRIISLIPVFLSSHSYIKSYYIFLYLIPIFVVCCLLKKKDITVTVEVPYVIFSNHISLFLLLEVMTVLNFIFSVFISRHTLKPLLIHL